MHIRFHRTASLLLLTLLAVLAGCHRAPQPAAIQTKSFPVKGVIVSTDLSLGEVLLSHEAIPGFMEAMTMPYPLKDKGIINELHAGDHITAVLLVDQVDGENRNPRLDQIVVTAQARPDYKPAVQYHVPEPGDAVPDFHLTNEAGKSIHFGQFKGRVLMITFIYTHCPFADFCPRMNHNFQRIDKELAADPALYKQTHLLSISFDPANDTPSVLQSYGRGYTPSFDHWEFAVPPADELPKVEQFFDLGVTPGDNGTLNHSLSTLVIDKKGNVAVFYHGNDWDPAEALASIRKAATS